MWMQYSFLEESSMASGGNVLIVGVGSGLSASLARLCRKDGMNVALAARNTDKLSGLAAETNAKTYACDASDPAAVETLFKDVTAEIGEPDLVVYNASARVRGAVEEIDPIAVHKALDVLCFGGFLVGQQAAKQMKARGSGTILFTGASASTKGYKNSSCFAMGKFGLRGLCQSMARELAPQNVHVAHFVIDGGINAGAGDERAAKLGPDGTLDPDAIAETYLHVHRQHRSAWTWEVELRPWVENF
jgi:NAD(P)-dependent dehydrogenase (short-subunit alcohol dehydrogenase family)